MKSAQKIKKELISEPGTITKRLPEVERLKKALGESEAKFAKVFSNNPVALSITRLSDGAIIEINNSYTRFSGYTREEMIGRKVSEINIWVNPADREQMLKTLREKGRISNEEYYFRVRSGEAHPVLLSAEEYHHRWRRLPARYDN